MSDPYRTLLRPLVTGNGAYAALSPEDAESALNDATVPASAGALLAPDEFVDRFTAEEFVAIAASADPLVRKLVFRLRTRQAPLDLASATVQQGLGYMAAIGLLSAERAAEIGTVPVGANIAPREHIGWPHERIWAADVIAARAMED